MLDTMRFAAKSWAMKAFLGLLLVSFLLWGIPEAFRYQGAGNALFSSGDSSIAANDYLFEQQNWLARYSAMTGRFLNPAELRAFAIPQQVMGQLQRHVLLDEEARRMKIGSSDETVLQLLQQDPLFHDATTGRFSPNSFLSFTQQMQIPQEAIFSQLERQARRDQILRSVTGGVNAPDVFYHALTLYGRETRSIDYIRLDPTSLTAISEPEEEALTAWFETQAQQFRAPEYRDITLMQMRREDLVNPQDVQDDALMAYYQQNRAALMAPERRIVEQLRFESREEADQAAAQLQTGMSFEDLVEARGQNLAEILLEARSKDEFPSLMAPEVFALAEGEISHVINDLAGPVILRLVSIEAPKPLEFQDVAQQLRQELAVRDSLQLMRENRDQIENARFDGASLTILAGEYGLELTQITVDASGITPQGEPVEGLPQQDALLKAAFQSAVGVDNDPLFDAEGYLWYHVENVIPARNKTLDEVRPEAVQAWKEAQAQRLLDEQLDAWQTQLQQGQNLAQLGAQNQLLVESVGGLQRGSVNAILGREANAAVFATFEGGYGAAPGPDGLSRLLFQVTGSADPVSTSRDTLPESEQAAIRAQFVRDMEGQFLLFAQDAHPVSQNLQLLNMLLNQ